MELSPEGIVAYVTSLIDTMPSAIMQGDVFALTITLILFFIAVVIINQLTGLLIRFLKKAILVIIVTLAFWQFIIMFYGKVTTEGFTEDTIIFGAIGFILGFVAISIALFVALRSYYEAQQGPVPSGSYISHDAGGGQSAPSLMSGAPESPLHSQGGLTALSATPAPEPAPPDTRMGATLTAMKNSLSVSNLKSDKSLGAVLAYLIIAQFGVFSSKTMPAPSFQVGIAFFVIFLIAGLVFIHFTYNNYLTGLRHLIMAILIGTIIAVVLGHFWGNIPFDQLLSLSFFQSDALVALVTGLALSLFMGGKG
jgi:hypothetical protein